MHAQYMALQESCAQLRVRADCTRAELDVARGQLAGLDGGLAPKVKRKTEEEGDGGEERAEKRARD
jgi:hypothetical protein